MKKIICLITIIFLTGCGAKYQINITDDSVEETINVSMYVDPTKGNNDVAESVDLNSIEAINSLKNTNLTVLTNSNDIFYNKEITNDGNLYNISLSYKYSKEQYKNSRVINECFENHTILFEKDRTYIHLSGKFYCYDNEDIDIVVKSSNKVNKSNGSKSGGSYHWTINQDNYNNVDIEIEISDKSKVRMYIYYGIAAIVLAVLLYFGFIAYGKIANRNNVNDI